MWVVVKIMVPFCVPIIIRHLLFRVPNKGPSNVWGFMVCRLRARTQSLQNPLIKEYTLSYNRNPS